MKYYPTRIPDVIQIKTKIYQDKRGHFFETYREREFENNGIRVRFVQENHSKSKAGVLRGLHYQIQKPQGKLIRVVTGEIYDVAVDLRKSSPTFGDHVGLMLSGQKGDQLWVPPGFAHGFYVLSDSAEISYKVTSYYAPEYERTVRWNDPTLDIQWPIKATGHPILSEKDSQGDSFEAAEVYQ